MAWQLQEAKNRFSEVVQKASTEGPQEVTVRGKRSVVIIAAEDFDRLRGRQQSFKEFLLSAPPWDDEAIDLVNDRKPWPTRDIDF